MPAGRALQVNWGHYKWIAAVLLHQTNVVDQHVMCFVIATGRGF